MFRNYRFTADYHFLHGRTSGRGPCPLPNDITMPYKYYSKWIRTVSYFLRYFKITTHYWLTPGYVLNILRANFYKQDQFWCSEITALQQITTFCMGGLVGGGHALYHMTLPCCTNITVSGLGPCHIFLDILNLPHITTDQPQFTYQIS